jgi:hypothetical protein
MVCSRSSLPFLNLSEDDRKTSCTLSGSVEASTATQRFFAPPRIRGSGRESDDAGGTYLPKIERLVGPEAYRPKCGDQIVGRDIPSQNAIPHAFPLAFNAATLPSVEGVSPAEEDLVADTDGVGRNLSFVRVIW